MRLRDDNVVSEISGLALVPDLAPTVSIIRSGYGSLKTVRQALKSTMEVPQRAYDFIGKEDGPEELKRSIKDVEKTVWCRRDLEIVWSRELEQVTLASRISRWDSAFLLDEIEDTLRRLFPHTKSLTLNAVEVQNPPVWTKRLLLWVQEDDISRPAFVEIDAADLIREEVYRYEQYVQSNPFFSRFVQLGSHCILWRLGGLMYKADFPSRRVHTFGELVRLWNVPRISVVFERIVEPLHAWQEEV